MGAASPLTCEVWVTKRHRYIVQDNVVTSDELEENVKQAVKGPDESSQDPIGLRDAMSARAWYTQVKYLQSETTVEVVRFCDPDIFEEHE